MLSVPALCVHVGLMTRQRRAQALQLAARQQHVRRSLPGRPGSIYARARRGYVALAESKQVPSCFADPLLLQDEELAAQAARVALAVGIDRATVQEVFQSRREDRFVWLRRGISPREADAVNALRLPAVGIQYEWCRNYPSAALAATVVGFRLHDGRGGGGLELSQDRRLAAEDGVQEAVADASRRPIWPMPEASRPPRDGCHVFLCMDAVIQEFLQQAVAESVEQFNAQWGIGVLANPQTGEILAMCSAPSFDPNTFNEAPADSLANRAITFPFEPGSAFKPVIAAAAVDAGLVGWQTMIDCESGVYRASRGGRISDHGKSFGLLSVADVVVFSSNIGMAKIGEMVGNAQLHEMVERFGFGSQTGIELPGESGGIVLPLSRWNGYSLRRVPFGQEIAVTGVQLTMAFCSLANGGLLLRPRLVDYVTDAGGQVVWRSRPVAVRRVLSPQASAQMLAVLRDAVERGTGQACRLEAWTSFGKTGTAQVAGVGGYNHDEYTSTFIGGAPAGDPRIVCLISVYRPDRSKGYYGAKVAAPYVKRVLEKTLRYLEVPPDKPTGRGGQRGRLFASAP